MEKINKFYAIIIKDTKKYTFSRFVNLFLKGGFCHLDYVRPGPDQEPLHCGQSYWVLQFFIIADQYHSVEKVTCSVWRLQSMVQSAVGVALR